MKNKKKSTVFFSIFAAALYAINIPASKLLLGKIPATMMAALLYLGAGTGVLILGIINKRSRNALAEKDFSRKELPYIFGMVILDIAAPVFLMIGLAKTTASNASLLNNFEIVTTAVIALCIFKEFIPKRLWVAIILVTVSSILLSFDGMCSFSFSIGSIFVLLACICWGFENNCTRMLSKNNPFKIVIIKGFGSGFGSLVIALIVGQTVNNLYYILGTLLLGFVAYGLSILFYVYAQRELGAAKTSTYYAISPFIGVFFSLIVFREIPSISFIIALLIMIMGTYIASTDKK